MKYLLLTISILFSAQVYASDVGRALAPSAIGQDVSELGEAAGERAITIPNARISSISLTDNSLVKSAESLNTKGISSPAAIWLFGSILLGLALTISHRYSKDQ